MQKFLFVCILFLLLPQPAKAQSDPFTDAARKMQKENEKAVRKGPPEDDPSGKTGDASGSPAGGPKQPQPKRPVNPNAPGGAQNKP
jgi:hypothetical protein